MKIFFKRVLNLKERGFFCCCCSFVLDHEPFSFLYSLCLIVITSRHSGPSGNSPGWSLGVNCQLSSYMDPSSWATCHSLYLSLMENVIPAGRVTMGIRWDNMYEELSAAPHLKGAFKMVQTSWNRKEGKKKFSPGIRVYLNKRKKNPPVWDSTQKIICIQSNCTVGKLHWEDKWPTYCTRLKGKQSCFKRREFFSHTQLWFIPKTQ